MYNTLTIMLATVGLAILVMLFCSYFKYTSQKVPGLNYCLIFIAITFVSVLLLVTCYFVQDSDTLLRFTALLVATMTLSNTAFALTMVFLIGKISEKRRTYFRLLFIVPVLVLVLAITNPFHHLIVESVEKSADSFGFFFVYGKLSAPLAIYSYILVGVVILNAFLTIRNAAKRNRRLIWIIVAISIFPSLFSLLEMATPYLAGIHPAYLLMFIPVLFITNIFYQYLHSARNKAISHTGEIYVLFDRWGSCVDANRAGREFFQRFCNTQAPTLLSLEKLVGQNGLAGLEEAEFELESDDAFKYYRISSFQISDTISRDCGDGFLIREVTEFREQMNKLSSLAAKDALTGIKNRRYFDEYSKNSVLHSARHNQPLTLLMLDIDHFKRVNDTYGHIIGDEVLITLCRICSQVLRKTDVFCRYGGEEFVILVEGTNKQGGMETAERILNAVNVQPFSTSAGDIPITVSIGGCSLTAQREDQIERWLECSDQMLYEAKRGGRNQIQYHKG
ncbi:diguanylate cyclase [Christensenellaceae bacterium OttesenSCG-928-K19]|nr:diguanylate cyclase [Christensenellaceae bacterium OttesenSCG-928-K19]